MTPYVYTKKRTRNTKKIFHGIGLGMLVLGLIFGVYTLTPLFAWEIYLKPAFASNNFESPIPARSVLTKKTIESLVNASTNSLQGNTWLPTPRETSITMALASYGLSIPKLNIENATVSTTDTDIAQHLVHFPKTALPPNKGTAVIFGHSTLPQLYNPKDYKTIFANIHSLTKNDMLYVTVNNTQYAYKIFSITIVDAEETSYLTQDNDDSNLTIVTCTPPGTTWKRLILKARIEKI